MKQLKYTLLIILFFININFCKAVTIIVDNTDDSGAGSLRSAIGISASGDIIDMTGISGTISLTTGEINIGAGKDIIINGPGMDVLTIDCGGLSRAFYINDADVEINNLKIINGLNPDGGGGIKAVYGSDLTLFQCWIKDCRSITNYTSRGGGIDIVSYDPDTWDENGEIVVEIGYCKIENCQAYIGGGVRVIGGLEEFVTIDIYNTTFNGNETGPFGSLISGNDGGALELIPNQNDNPDLTDVSIKNSTFSNNATLGPVNASTGAGISLGTGTYQINSCTVTDNRSIRVGGGVSFWGSGTCEITNSIIAANEAVENNADIDGNFISGGYNLIGTVGIVGWTLGAGDITGTDPDPIDPLLLPLADNGGVGYTHAFDCTSLAVDAGGLAPALDQRDNSRICSVDIGAFEYQTPCCSEPILIIDSDTICKGDCTTLTVFTEEASTYTWSPDIVETDSTLIVCPDVTTLYQVIVTKETGGIDTLTAIITVIDYPALFDLGNDTLLCPGETLILDVTGLGEGVTWQDNTGDPIFEVSETGEYYVEISNWECSVSDTILVDYVDIPLDLGPDTALCFADFIVDAEFVESTYLWHDGSTSPTFGITDTGVYYVTVVHEPSGCINSDTIVVTSDSLSFSLGSDTLICVPDGLILNPGMVGADYLWSDLSIEETLIISEEGTYSVDVTWGYCSGYDEIEVDFEDLDVLISVLDTTGCAPQNVNFTGFISGSTDIDTWLWEFGDGGNSALQDPSHFYSDNGEFEVVLTVTSEAGCVATNNRLVNIYIYDYPDASFTHSPTSPYINDIVEFGNTSSGEESWLWDFGNGLSSTEENPTTSYEINGDFVVSLVVDNHGCLDSSSITIIVKEEILFFVPNSFTPDGNSFNDTFKPVFTSGFDPYDYHLTIINRWGETIFESYNAAHGWDGAYRGNVAKDGVYIWKIEYADINNDKKYSEIGHINLLK